MTDLQPPALPAGPGPGLVNPGVADPIAACRENASTKDLLMNEQAEFDVDELMREIRYELAGSNGLPGGSPAAGIASGLEPGGTAQPRPSFRLRRLSESSGVIPRHSQYDLHALLAFHDEDFVRNAYVALLGREPDSEGAPRYLGRLRNGDLAKVEVLGRIRYSPEGRAAGVRVTGLLIPFGLRTLRRIPVIGYAVGVVQYVFRLPTVVRNLERLEAVVFLHRLEMRRDVNGIEREIEVALRETHADLSGSIEITAARLSAFEIDATRDGRRVGDRVEELASQIADKANSSELVELNRRLQDERSAQDEQWASRLDGLRELVDIAQASVAALEQGKADRALLEASLGPIATEILELRNAARRSAADVSNVISSIGQSAADIAEVRAAIGTIEDRMTGQPSAAALTESIAVAETAKTTARQIDAKLASLSEQLIRYQQEVIEQDRRLSTLLDEARRRLPDQPFGPDQLATFVQEQEHMLDGLYLAFEDQFRGTREDIMQRVAIYLPYVRNANAGTANAPVLDLGCGRGEWLELLSGHDLVAQGVDSNRFAAAFCRERGLSVVEADALEYLRTLQTGSLGAITAIHVIEHMPFGKMLALFDEARRVLRTGGVAIFETPNPENVVVGACNFYYDPTHVRPLPPEPLRFVFSQRGFADVDILRLHPRHDTPNLGDKPRPLELEVARRFFGEQDYAVLGYKRTPT